MTKRRRSGGRESPVDTLSVDNYDEDDTCSYDSTFEESSSPSSSTKMNDGPASASCNSNPNPLLDIQSTAPLLAGILGGAVSTALLFPLDLIKVRMQVNEGTSTCTSGSSSNSVGRSSAVISSSTSGKHSTTPSAATITSSTTSRSSSASPSSAHHGRLSMLSSFRTILRYEGYRGLYSGLSPALVASAISWGGYFFLYEGLKRKVGNWKMERIKDSTTEANHSSSGSQFNSTQQLPDRQTQQQQQQQLPPVRLSPAENFITACSAGAFMVLLTNPIWLIKTRMQVQLRHLKQNPTGSTGNSLPVRPYTGLFDAARTIIRDEGFVALYKGSSVALLMVSHGGIQFCAYEFLRNHFGDYTKAERSKKGKSERWAVREKLEDSLGYLTMGAASKIMASTATYPLQVIKARLQQRSEAVSINGEGKMVVERRVFQGVFDCVKRIWVKEGMRGFFKGCLPNALRVAPGSAVTFVVYESVMEALLQDGGER